MERELRRLDTLKRAKSHFDKRHELLYGGKGVFPNKERLDRLREEEKGTVGSIVMPSRLVRSKKAGPKKGVQFHEEDDRFSFTSD